MEPVFVNTTPLGTGLVMGVLMTSTVGGQGNDGPIISAALHTRPGDLSTAGVTRSPGKVGARLLGCIWEVGTMWQQQQFQMQSAVSCDSVQSSMSPRPFRIKSPVQTVTTLSTSAGI